MWHRFDRAGLSLNAVRDLDAISVVRCVTRCEYRVCKSGWRSWISDQRVSQPGTHRLRSWRAVDRRGAMIWRRTVIFLRLVDSVELGVSREVGRGGSDVFGVETLVVWHERSFGGLVLGVN